MHSIEVIFTPALLPLYEIKSKTVVIIDILRATSSMCVAFHTGVNKILPVSTPEECRIFKDFDFIIAAERNAEKVEGFDMGNSPFEYENPFLKGKNIAFTTTNGTKAIRLAKNMGAGAVVIGSFLNLDYLCARLKEKKHDIVLLCAGWKDKYNLEDTLFAGAVISRIGQGYSIDDDASISALSLFDHHRDNLEGLVRRSSHARRFTRLHMQTDDVAFCMQQNLYNILPVIEGEYIVAAKPAQPAAPSAAGSVIG